MRTLWQTATQIVWALWFGGLITVFISVITLFNFDHSLAVQTAPRIFHAFETYQLGLAAACVILAAGWGRKGLLTLFALAAAGAVTSTALITPRISQLQQLGQTHTDQFARLHGLSMMVYTADAVVLLAAGILLPYTAANKANH